MKKLNAFRMRKDGYQLVGTLSFNNEEMSFAYDASYLMDEERAAISSRSPADRRPTPLKRPDRSFLDWLQRA